MRRVALVLLVIAAAGCAKRPPVPALADLGSVAPEVRPLAEEALNALAQNPSDGAWWGRLGMVCEANGLLDAAHRAYSAATEVEPSGAKWWYRLAFIDARREQFDEAIRHARKAIDREPNYAPAHQRLGRWLLDRNDIAGAEREYTRATELEPKNATAWTDLARLYLERGENERTVDTLQRALSIHAGDRYALQLLGTAYQRMGRTGEAETALAIGSTGAPEFADPWTLEMQSFERSFAYRLKNATQAFLANPNRSTFTQLERFRFERPDDVALLSHLGEVFVEGRRFDQGIPILEQALVKDPQRFEAQIILASAYLEQNDLAHARIAIDRAISIHPTLGRAHEIRGAILSRAGDKRGALEALQLAVRYDPRSTRALVWKGRTEMQLGKLADAQESFARATRQDPTVPEGWIGVADVAMALKQFDRAAAALEQATRFNASNTEVEEAARRLAAVRH